MNQSKFSCEVTYTQEEIYKMYMCGFTLHHLTELVYHSRSYGTKKEARDYVYSAVWDRLKAN